MKSFKNHSFFYNKTLNKRRNRTRFEDNITASISMPPHLLFPISSRHPKLFQTEDFMKKRIIASSDLIFQHAERRVLLLFYSFIAFYNKNVEIKRGRTIEQHGMGSKINDTAACHHSLFPNFIIKNKQTSDDSDFENTQFARSLNMIIEQPTLVNIFDNHLEGGGNSFVMTNALNLINQVSNNNLDPILAMNDFFPSMNNFFTGYHAFVDKSKFPYSQALMLICEYQRKGTFSAADNLKIKKEYVALMLGLKAEECSLDSSFLHPHYLALQREIWINKANTYKPYRP